MSLAFRMKTFKEAEAFWQQITPPATAGEYPTLSGASTAVYRVKHLGYMSKRAWARAVVTGKVDAFFGCKIKNHQDNTRLNDLFMFFADAAKKQKVWLDDATDREPLNGFETMSLDIATNQNTFDHEQQMLKIGWHRGFDKPELRKKIAAWNVEDGVGGPVVGVPHTVVGVPVSPKPLTPNELVDLWDRLGMPSHNKPPSNEWWAVARAVGNGACPAGLEKPIENAAWRTQFSALGLIDSNGLATKELIAGFLDRNPRLRLSLYERWSSLADDSMEAYQDLLGAAQATSGGNSEAVVTTSASYFAELRKLGLVDPRGRPSVAFMAQYETNVSRVAASKQAPKPSKPKPPAPPPPAPKQPAPPPPAPPVAAKPKKKPAPPPPAPCGGGLDAITAAFFEFKKRKHVTATEQDGPDGFKFRVNIRGYGDSVGGKDFYIFTPEPSRKKLRSVPELRKYMAA